LKILLVDVDSKIPNLALMKLSAWHKARGHTVGFNVTDPDMVFISVIYAANKWRAYAVKQMFPKALVSIGGPAFPKVALNDAIEHTKPDYDLYPSEYSMGFTTRGCIRKCSWCIVPIKEGPLQRWDHPLDFHDDQFDTIMLLDNNWLADPEWFFETSNWIIGHNLTVWEHGLDIRLVTPKIAQQLLSLNMKTGYHFAFDTDDIEPIVHKKLLLLEDEGFNIRHDVQVYVYVDNDAEFMSGLRRARLLKEWGTNAFVMFNINAPLTDRIKKLRRWANRKHLFWSHDPFISSGAGLE